MSEPTITVTEHRMHVPRSIRRTIRRNDRRIRRRRIWASRSWSPRLWRRRYVALSEWLDWQERQLRRRLNSKLLFGVDYTDAAGNPIDAAEVRPES